MLEGRQLTKTRIEHVKSHSVALFSTGDRDETLIAIVLRLIDLDHTATDLSDLIDLLSALADDGADHVVGDEDLLGQGRPWHTSMRGGTAVRTGMGSWTNMGRRMMRLGMRSAAIRSTGNRSTVRHWNRGMGLRVLRMTAIRLGIRVGRHVLGSSLIAPRIVVAVSKVAASGLGRVWNDLHTTRDRASRATTASSISRRRWTSETFVELLEQCAGNIISRNMDSIRNTHNNK